MGQLGLGLTCGVYTSPNGGGGWVWQERKSSLKGDVEQLFSIFPEGKGEEIDLQLASRGIYAKYREVFWNFSPLE